MSVDSLIALVLRDTQAEWTTLQRRKHRMEISQQKSVEINWPAEIEDHRSSEAAAHLKSVLPDGKGRLGIAIPANRVLMRVVELPSTDLEELEDMADLQIDKISPFPSDQMALAIEVLERDEAAESSRVLIAAVQHDYIDELGELYLMAGLYPQSVDVDVLGWWYLIREAGKVASDGQEAVVIHDGESAQLLIVRDGQPVVIRALDADLSAGELADEIEYTLMTMEGTWGAFENSRITMWTRGAALGEMKEALAGAAGIPVESGDLDSLPPLSEGLSRRMALGEGRSLDLAPHAWKQSIQSRKYQRRAVAVAAISVGVWAILMGGLWFWANRQKQALGSTQRAIVQLQNEVDQVRELKSQVERLQRYADRTYSGLECLREVSAILPDSVDIISFTYNKESQVNLRGEADTDRPINDFIGNLENSALFTSVRTEAIQTRTRNGRTRSQFRVTMMLPATEEEEPES